jgi:endo-1,3(4)-beta-glucanase
VIFGRRQATRGARAVTVITAALAALAMVAGCAATPPAASASSEAASASSGANALTAGLPALAKRSVTPLPPMRLAKGLAPPTNRWFSGLVFGATPLPVFPLPLSFGLNATGFAFGVPNVTTNAQTISGEFNPAVTVSGQVRSTEVTAYDNTSVTITQRNASGAAIGTIVIAEGAPTVSYTAARKTVLTVGHEFAADGAGLYAATVGGSSYGLATRGSLSGGALTLTRGQSAVFFAVPKGRTARSLAHHVSPLESVSLRYSTDATRATTTLDYHSPGSTLVAAMPHQLAGLHPPDACNLGSYPSIYGALRLCAGSTLSWSVPRVSPSDQLTVSSLSASDAALLRTQLTADIAATPVSPADSYYGGKWLYRLANLAQIAHGIGDSHAETAAMALLRPVLEQWTAPGGCTAGATRCFIYDPKAEGVVGITASFGSDQFNDHHFHYGYFLYAASVAVSLDPSLMPRVRPVIGLLAADIGSPTASASFPERRVFDAYAGHSWASGYAPFADGNNQESSSEAVNAWNGLALWAQATHDTALAGEAEWMLSAEAASARAYWTNFPTASAPYVGLGQSTLGINWGGKRDAATWFSALPTAVIGIQVIPMGPAAGYLGGDPSRIAENVAGAAAADYRVPLGDYLLMYSALEGKTAAGSALKVAETLPEKWIDDGDSRSYVLAWLFSHR